MNTLAEAFNSRTTCKFDISSREKNMAVRTDNHQIMGLMRSAFIFWDNVMGFNEKVIPAQFATVAIFA